VAPEGERAVIAPFLLAALVAAAAALGLWSRRTITTIYPPNVGLLYRDGVFERELPPGRYVRLDPTGRTRIVDVSLAGLPVNLGEVTVLSKDQFSFRLGLAPVLRIVDARQFVESQSAVVQQALHPFMPMAAAHPALLSRVAAAAMEAVAARTLAEILADQGAIAASVQERLRDSVPSACVEQVLLVAINLPPETRKMFTDVERARIEAQASLERARGEQAALRVLANAARLVNDNPALANLRLLQAVESSKGSTTIVIGNPAAPLPGLGLPPEPAAPSGG